MKQHSADKRKINVLIFGHKEFSQLMTSVIPEFRDQATFHIIDSIVGSVAEIEQYIKTHAPDAIVSAGSNAAYLKSALDLPVVSLDPTAADMIKAVKRAALVSEAIVIINFDEASAVVPLLQQALNVPIQEEVYTTADQARELFQLNRHIPGVAFVGASLVCGLAAKYGLPAFLLYTPESAKRTLHQAIDMARESLSRQHSTALNDWVMNKSKTPVVMTDESGDSVIVNQAARQDLGIGDDVEMDLASLVHPVETLRPTDGECSILGQDWWFHQDRINVLGQPRYVYQLYRKKPVAEGKKATTSQHQMVYSSTAINQVMRQVESFSSSPSNVLIHGESGTGKELIARAVHQHSPFAGGRFVALNCSAIPTTLFEGELFGHRDGAFTGSKRGGRKGLIEEAQGGVLFLDEVSELALDQQAKLLRFLQERHYRPLGANEEIPAYLKLVAAANKDLKELVSRGEFREDLYFRLNVFKIEIPPLRHRQEDVLTIAGNKLLSLLSNYGSPYQAEQILEHTRSTLTNYAWPGNVRELENVLERMVASLPMLNELNEINTLLRQIAPELFVEAKLDGETGLVRSRELEMVAEAMIRFSGDKQRVAEYLGMSQTTLWRRLKRINQN